MRIRFELGSEFLEREGVSLSVRDMAYGFQRGLVRAPVVVEAAAREVQNGCHDAVVRDVAALAPEEFGHLGEVLERVQTLDVAGESDSSARKWLYLELKAAYQRADDLQDPLGVVEEIYAEFDYPVAVEGFVRYMPLRAGDEAGVRALMDRWEIYLTSERDALRVGSTAT